MTTIAAGESCMWSSVSTRWLFIAGWLLGLLFTLNQMFAGDDYVLDDEITHYWRSRSVWVNQELLLDAWTRPGRNLLHAPVAPLGLQFTRLYTFAIVCLGAWLTVLLAREWNLKHVVFIPLFFFAQPWVIELGYGVLTQTPFLVVWIAGIYLNTRRRDAWAGLCFGYLPLVRHEGIVLSAFYAAYCLYRGHWRGLLTLPVPLLGIDLAAYLAGAPLPTDVYTVVKPTDAYGHGTLWHFLDPMLHSVGYGVAVLSAFGLMRRRSLVWREPLLLSYPLYFLLHSVIYWKGLFASGGYVFFLMPMAPLFALLAADGVEVAVDRLGSTHGRRLVAICCVVAVLHSWSQPERLYVRQDVPIRKSVAAIAWHLLRGSPLEKDLTKRELDHAIDWLAAHRKDAYGSIICSHPYVKMRLDLFEDVKARQTDVLPLEEINEPVVFIWESKFTPENTLRDRATFERLGWRNLTEFGRGRVVIYANYETSAFEGGEQE